MMKKYTIVYILVTLALLAGVFFFAQKQSVVESPKEPAAVSSEEVLKQLSFPGNTLDTSDWQTYRNEEFGFEVRYPNRWGAEFFDTSNSIFDGSGNNRTKKSGFLALFPSNIRNINSQISALGVQNLSLAEQIARIKNSDLSPRAEVKRYIKINNTFGVQVVVKNSLELLGFEVHDRYILEGKNNVTYEFRGRNELNTEKYQLEIEQILLSFKLIK